VQFIFIYLEIFIIGKQTDLSLSRGLERECVCVRVCVIHIVVMMQRIAQIIRWTENSTK